MNLEVYALHGVRVAELQKAGGQLLNDRQAIEIMSEGDLRGSNTAETISLNRNSRGAFAWFLRFPLV